MTLTSDLLDRCRALGFALAGVASARPSAYADELRAWLAAGRHGSMDYLARNVELRLDPAAFVPGARSIVCVADRYHDGTADPPVPGQGRVARYARGEDYHRVIRRRLHTLCDDLREQHPGETFRASVDTAPVLEREHAARAGLGAVGKHTLLIEPGVGSYVLLGSVVTTLALDSSAPVADSDPCGACTRCIDACPTGAITPFRVDATRCVSYTTIEHRGAIDADLHAGHRDWIFGCDVCQEVCPHNQPTERTRAAAVHEAYAPRRTGFDLLEVLGWDEDARRAAFVTSAMKRAKLDMMKRNALIAAGNALATRPDAPLRARVEALAQDATESALVRETAAETLAQLG